MHSQSANFGKFKLKSRCFFFAQPCTLCIHPSLAFHVKITILFCIQGMNASHHNNAQLILVREGGGPLLYLSLIDNTALLPLGKDTDKLPLASFCAPPVLGFPAFVHSSLMQHQVANADIMLQLYTSPRQPHGYSFTLFHLSNWLLTLYNRTVLFLFTETRRMKLVLACLYIHAT